MSRRSFLSLLPQAVLLPLSCVPAPAQPPPPPSTGARTGRARIKAVCFDLFTLFDPRGVVAVAEQVLPSGAAELCREWRTRQFEYSWLRAAAGRYANFRRVTEEALVYAARARGVVLEEGTRRTLLEAYATLPLWPDTREMLERLRARGLRLAPLTNYSPDMLDRLLSHGSLGRYFEARISTDAARTYKPDPRAYALALGRLGLEKEAIAFSAFGGWDAAGARWFGFPTFWVNRLGAATEELEPIDGSGRTLGDLETFVAAWR